METHRATTETLRVLAYLVLLLVLRVMMPTPEARAQGSPYGVNAHIPSAELLDEVTAAGIGWVRIDMVWAYIEPEPNVYDWSIYDEVVADATQRGLKIFATLAYTPGWATLGEPMRGQPASPSEWQEICYLAAARYRGRIQAWGLWNEPNLEQFWKSTIGAYVVLIVEGGARGIRAGDPHAMVCGPDLAHLTSADWDSWLDKVLYRVGGDLDVVTHHVYPGDADHEDVTRALEDGGSFPWDPPSVKHVLRNRGWSDEPFWLTETGLQSDEWGEATQAEFVEQLLEDWFSESRSAGWVHRIFLYEMADHTEVQDISYGIVEVGSTMRRKPAWTAFRSFIEQTPVDHAEPVTSSFPQAVRPAEPFVATIRVRNTGSTTWTPARGYRIELIGSSEGWTVERTGQYLDHTVPPGATTTFSLTLTPPSLPDDATYQTATLRWQMGRQARWRFGDPLRIELDVTPYEPTRLERLPVSWIGPEGAEARLTVEATSPSGELSFLWLRNSLELPERAPFEGVTSPTLTITRASRATEGEYICVLTSPAGSIRTPPVRLQLDPTSARPRLPAHRLGRAEAAKRLADFLAKGPGAAPPPSPVRALPDHRPERTITR